MTQARSTRKRRIQVEEMYGRGGLNAIFIKERCRSLESHTRQSSSINAKLRRERRLLSRERSGAKNPILLSAWRRVAIGGSARSAT
jgi:hypothetical protein